MYMQVLFKCRLLAGFFFQRCFDFLLRLFSNQVNETLANCNGYAQSAYDDSGTEDKPMLLAKTNGTTDDQGITALINRQLQGN